MKHLALLLLLSLGLSAQTTVINGWGGSGGGGTWGSITGTLSDQTDLQTALSGKQATLTIGNFTEATSNILTITGGTGAIIGSGLTVQVKQASGSQAGYLGSSDWTTFNSKLTSPLTTLGDVLYGGASGVATRLAGNTSATRNFFCQTGTGTVSAVPSWCTIAAGDVPTLNQNTTGTAANVTGTVAVANGGTGTASTLTGLLRGNASAFTAAELSGDCTTSASNVVTCTKTNGSSFATSATTDATNASNISSGTLGAARMPALSGAVTSSAGSTVTTLALPMTCGGGRLTLTSGVPVTTSDVTGATTIYYTAYVSQYVPLWNGTTWQTVEFTDNKSIALGTLTSGKNYDVFGYLSSGDLAMEFSAAWTNDTTRADAIARQDGVQVKSSDHTRSLLGTFRTTSTTATEDSGGGVSSQSGGKRFLWNACNKVPRNANVIDTTANWAYSTATIRQADNASGNKVEYVTGEAGTMIDAQVRAMFAGVANSSAATAGVGVDSTTAYSGLYSGLFNNAAANQVQSHIGGTYRGYPGLGYHYIAWLEQGAGSSTTSTFIGLGGAQSGLSVVLNPQ